MDDGTRGRHAVTVSLTLTENEELLLNFDEAKSTEANVGWKQLHFITSLRANANGFLHADWTDEDLRAIGRIVASRLSSRLEFSGIK